MFSDIKIELSEFQLEDYFLKRFQSQGLPARKGTTEENITLGGDIVLEQENLVYIDIKLDKKDHGRLPLEWKSVRTLSEDALGWAANPKADYYIMVSPDRKTETVEAYSFSRDFLKEHFEMWLEEATSEEFTDVRLYDTFIDTHTSGQTTTNVCVPKNLFREAISTRPDARVEHLPGIPLTRKDRR